MGLLPLFVVAHFGHHLHAALLVPLMPYIRDDFGLDYTQAGVLVSIFTVAYGVSQLPAGWLADRIGRRVLIGAGVSGVALCGILAALSPTYAVMAACLVLLGMTGGGYHPSAAPIITESVDPQKRGRALGFHQIGGSVGFFLVPLIAAGTASVLGWRGSFVVLAIPVIIFGVFLYWFLGRRKKASIIETVVHDELSVKAGRSVLRRLVPFLALSIAGQSVIFSVVSFLPLFAVDNLGTTEEMAAVFLSLAYSAGLWSGPVGGYLSDRFGAVPVILIVSLLAGPAIYLLNLVSYGWSMVLVVMTIGMCMDMRMPVSEAYIIGYTTERNRSTVLGIYYFASRGGPGIVTPVLGYLIDRFGFSNSFTVMGVALLGVVLVCAMFLRSGRAD
ncbi:MAG: MFS transporter [Dehalococcoidales bacterium]|nr:MAG: MFS transporter [Dehalococcoidales bacterium]